MNARIAIAILLILPLVGCAQQTTTISDGFPLGRVATPWLLDGKVWEGSFERAADGLGEEAANWRPMAPEHVWLAVYRHETSPDEKLVVRAFQFPTAAKAERVYDTLKPAGADPLRGGDEACWLNDGVLVRWGKLVFEIFGNTENEFANTTQAMYLMIFLEKQMPADLPQNPV